MKVKPEDLRTANSIAGIKEGSAGASKKNYWNGVHKLTTKEREGKLLLKTNDGSLWLEWSIPYEDSLIEIDSLVQEAAFDYAAKMEGGSLEVTRANRIIHLGKQQFSYPLREETPQQYPDPKPEGTPIRWTCPTATLASCLRFVAPFIDETNPNANKSVATLFTNGELKAGNPQRFAFVEGLNAKADMSFKSRTCKAVSTFLSRIGDIVEISVYNNLYEFKDPVQGHRLAVLAETGRFMQALQDLSNRILEIDQVDRKTLYQRAVVFGGALREGIDRLNIEIKGENELASLKVSTPGEQNDIAQDEFGIYRTFPEKANEAPEQLAERKKPIEYAMSRQALVDSLGAMDGTTITFRYCGRMTLIEDELVAEDGGAALPKKTVLILTKSLAQAAQEEIAQKQKLVEETGAKKKAEEEKAKKAKEEDKKTGAKDDEEAVAVVTAGAAK